MSALQRRQKQGKIHGSKSQITATPHFWAITALVDIIVIICLTSQIIYFQQFIRLIFWRFSMGRHLPFLSQYGVKMVQKWFLLSHCRRKNGHFIPFRKQVKHG